MEALVTLSGAIVPALTTGINLHAHTIFEVSPIATCYTYPIDKVFTQWIAIRIVITDDVGNGEGVEYVGAGAGSDGCVTVGA